MARDRVYINSDYRKMIDAMKDTDILGFNMVENKDSFMLAVALGVDNPIPVQNKDGWFLTKNLRTADKALLAAVLLGTANDDAEVESYADIDKALDLCEECAESGFNELKKKKEAADYDAEAMESTLLQELDYLYAANVEGNL